MTTVFLPASQCGPECLPATWPRASRLVRGYRQAAFTATTAFNMTLLPAALKHLRGDRHFWLRRTSMRTSLRNIGVDLRITGQPATEPALLVANHISWLDAMAIVAIDGRARIVANASNQQRRWHGAFIRAGGTLFVDRSNPRDIRRFITEVTDNLRRGETVAVFPEGVTGCGHAPEPFRPAVFQAAVDAAVRIVPISLRYLDNSGRPTPVPAALPREPESAAIARTLAMRRLTIHVHLHPPLPVPIPSGGSRKDRQTLAQEAQRIVQHNL